MILNDSALFEDLYSDAIKAVKFDASQPRDDHGRWTSSGTITATRDALEQVIVRVEQDGDLSAPELQAMRDYVVGGKYIPMNTLLRTGEPGAGQSSQLDATRARIVLLDSAIAHGDFLEDVTLYRGLGGRHGLRRDANVGDVVTDLGYVSLTANKEVAQRFANDHQGIVVQVQAPKGMSVLHVEAQPRSRDYDEDMTRDRENEFVLPRGVSFTVIHKDEHAFVLRASATQSSKTYSGGVVWKAIGGVGRFGWSDTDIVVTRKPTKDEKYGPASENEIKSALADDELPPASQVAAMQEPGLARALLAVWRKHAAGIDIPALTAACGRSGAFDAVLDALQADALGERQTAALLPRLTTCVRLGFEEGAKPLRAVGVRFAKGGLKYSETQPRVPAGSDAGGEFSSGVAGGTGVVELSRAERALATYKPSTRDKQKRAAESQAVVANAVKGQDLPDNEPVDVIVTTRNTVHGIEVKTLLDNDNDKITMHKASLARKEEWVDKNDGVGHTIVVDARGETRAYYYKEGFGSFRLGSMQRVALAQLRRLVVQ